MAVLEACLEQGSGQGEVGAKGGMGSEGRQIDGWARFCLLGKNRQLGPCGAPGAGNLLCTGHASDLHSLPPA